MAPLVLEGDTLGQRHQHYNNLLKAAICDEKFELAPLNYDDPDVDNLLRIDVACSRRNVDYVLDVLQCDDMLYVSRAIKRSTWLITDDQYAHIINPQHLYNELFPMMTTKAQNKLILAIRLNLKNETRVEEFYHYYSDDVKVAQKWLPHCSSTLKEKMYTDYNLYDITTNTFKRQCEISVNALKCLLKASNWHYIVDKMKVSMVIVSKYPEEYLDIIITLNDFDTPKFGVRATKRIMQRCPEKVIKNFEKLCGFVHLPTFAKYFKKDDVQAFLTKQALHKNMKAWITYDNIRHFIKYLPSANRFEFVKTLIIDKEISPTVGISDIDAMARRDDLMIDFGESLSNAHIYRWYQFAPFDVAITKLKKLIRLESSPLERHNMLNVLLHCARGNRQQVYTLLKFYRAKHMNEPFKFKAHFVNALLSLGDMHNFDNETWNILHDIFSSMEVFIKSENCVPQCIKAIIVYKLLRNEDIPEIIEKKLEFDTFTNYRKKLDDKEADILVTYLYKLEINKLNKLPTNNEVEMATAVKLLTNVLNLLKHWNKNISDYPEVLEKIRNFTKTIKNNLDWKTNLSSIYDVEKKWRRHLFEESLGLKPNDEACVNALRHDPGLLLRCSASVAAMRSSDAISLKHTLRKLRIYWPQTLAEKWTEAYLEALEKPNGHKATTEGICILLPRKRFLNLLQKYVPVETKIDWSNIDTTLLSLQKNIFKRLKLIRPSINLDDVLFYAKDDYLQFTLPSLTALMANMSKSQVSEYIPLLFESPVSLKKHGLRLAFNKLKFSEMKDIVENMWRNTSNSSIKTILFKKTFDLLKKERKHFAIEQLWELLNMFIENLNSDENRAIYYALGKPEDVPLIVRPQFFIKSYKYIKTLPAQANCETIIEQLDSFAPKIVEHLETSFVEDVLLIPVNDFVLFTTEKKEPKTIFDIDMKLNILTSYIINSEDKETQLIIYEKYLVPILDSCFELWKTTKNGEYTVRNKCFKLLRKLINNMKLRTLKNFTVHSQIFKNIETKLRKELSFEENYHLINYWGIVVLFVESLNTLKDNTKSPDRTQIVTEEVERRSRNRNKIEEEIKGKWDAICTAVAPSFGKSCLDYLKLDISTQLNALVTHFAKALRDVLDLMELGFVPRLQILKYVLDVDVPVSYLVVLDLVCSSFYTEDLKEQKLRRQIIDTIELHPSTVVKISFYENMYAHPQCVRLIPNDDDNCTAE